MNFFSTVQKSKMMTSSDVKKEKEGLRLGCDERFEDNGLHVDSSNIRRKAIDTVLDQEVDVVGLGGNGRVSSKKIMDDPDETEESSSFGNTFSGSEEESVTGSIDMEVESRLSAENGEQAMSHGLGKLFKRRRVTDHWRAYISPLTWRCQWLELHMNELRSQTLVYRKELAAYRRKKQFHQKTIELHDSVSRAIPLVWQKHKRSAMKRKKRKILEDEVDASSYKSSHAIFSYYEKKRPETDCQTVHGNAEDQVRVDEDVDNAQVYERLLQSLRSDDDSLEEMILDLDNLQSRIVGLKTQLGDVMSKNPRNTPSSDVATKSFTRSINLLTRSNGDAKPAQAASDNELEVPGSAVSSNADAAEVATNGALSRLVAVKAEVTERISHGDTAGSNRMCKEEGTSCSEEATPSSKDRVLETSVKRSYTGKKRGRKPKSGRSFRSDVNQKKTRRFS